MRLTIKFISMFYIDILLLFSCRTIPYDDYIGVENYESGKIITALLF